MSGWPCLTALGTPTMMSRDHKPPEGKASPGQRRQEEESSRPGRSQGRTANSMAAAGGQGWGPETRHRNRHRQGCGTQERKAEVRGRQAGHQGSGMGVCPQGKGSAVRKPPLISFPCTPQGPCIVRVCMCVCTLLGRQQVQHLALLQALFKWLWNSAPRTDGLRDKAAREPGLRVGLWAVAMAGQAGGVSLLVAQEHGSQMQDGLMGREPSRRAQGACTLA